MAFKHLLAGVAAVALMAPPALAQDIQQPQVQSDQMQVAQQDRNFATEAAQGGLMEASASLLNNRLRARKLRTSVSGWSMITVRPTTS